MRLMAATRFHPEETLLWSVGLLFALSLHLGVVLGVLLWGDDTTPPPLSSAVMMELAALPVAPPKPEPVPEPEPEPVPEPKPEPKPKPEPIIPPPPPKPKPEPVPEIAPVVEPEVALPAPPKVEPEPRKRSPPPAQEKVLPPEPVSRPPTLAAAAPPVKPVPSAPKAAAPLQSELIPLVRVPPQYPSRAVRRGIDGSVTVAFIITEKGLVRDPEVVESHPPGIFDEAALRAIKRWKFKPKQVGGQWVEQRATQTIEFELARW